VRRLSLTRDHLVIAVIVAVLVGTYLISMADHADDEKFGSATAQSEKGAVKSELAASAEVQVTRVGVPTRFSLARGGAGFAIIAGRTRVGTGERPTAKKAAQANRAGAWPIGNLVWVNGCCARSAAQITLVTHRDRPAIREDGEDAITEVGLDLPAGWLHFTANGAARPTHGAELPKGRYRLRISAKRRGADEAFRIDAWPVTVDAATAVLKPWARPRG
jgi:hypothetical protein